MNNFKNRIRLNSTEDEIVNYYDKNGKKKEQLKEKKVSKKAFFLKLCKFG